MDTYKIERLFHLLMERLDRHEKMLDDLLFRSQRQSPNQEEGTECRLYNGERLYDNQDLCLMLPHAPAEDLLQRVGRGEVPCGAYRLLSEREDGGLQGPHPITINVSQLKVNQDGKEKRRKRRADSP